MLFFHIFHYFFLLQIILEHCVTFGPFDYIIQALLHYDDTFFWWGEYQTWKIIDVSKLSPICEILTAGET